MIIVEHLGFFKHNLNGMERIDFIMPEQLKKTFFATLYLKNDINCFAEGNQEIVWNKMSHNYNNEKLVAPNQVHGTKIIKSEEKNSLPIRINADGIYIDEKTGCYSSLRFADCAPVVIAGTFPKPWMFFLHSGFWGTVKNISSCAIDYLLIQHKDFKITNTSFAWIGTSIRKNCYSRDINENKTSDAMKIFDINNIEIKERSVFFDIPGQIKNQLKKCGFRNNNIYFYDECTCCKSETYYSYRAGDKKCRLFLLGKCTTN